MERMELPHRMGRSPQVVLDEGEVNAETPTGISRRPDDSSAHFLYGKAT
jgi:hypothetical protein